MLTYVLRTYLLIRLTKANTCNWSNYNIKQQATLSQESQGLFVFVRSNSIFTVNLISQSNSL